MPRNAFLDEAKDAQWPLPEAVWSGLNKMKLTPTVGAFIDRYKPDTWGRGETLIRCTTRQLFIALIEQDRLVELHTALGELLGIGTPKGASPPPAGSVTPVGRAR